MAITLVAPGTAGTANGAAPALTLPAGLADGDLMVAVFYSRETVDGTVSMSAGWTQIENWRSSGGLIAAWYRIYQTGDTAPTLTVTGHAGGTSGDSAIAQMCAWRGVDTSTPLAVKGTLSTFSPTLNIGPISGLSLSVGQLVVVLGGKLDDWTSVATLTGDLGWVEIGEPDNTSGADAGMVWNFATAGSATTVTDKTFVVTGGTSVASTGLMFSFNVGSTAVTGAAALSADAGLAAAGTSTAIASATLSAGGELTANGTAGTPPITGAAALSADATLTAVGTREQLAAAALTAQSTLAAAGTVGSTPPGAALSAQATLTAAGSLTRVATATLTAQASLTATATATLRAAATLAAHSQLQAAGHTTHHAQAALTGQATLVCAGDIPAPYEPIRVSLDAPTTGAITSTRTRASSLGHTSTATIIDT